MDESTINTISQRLRKLRDNKETRDDPPEEHTEMTYSGLVPPEYTRLRDSGSSEMIKRMSSLTWTIPQLPTKYANIPALAKSIASKTDFPDDAWSGKPAIELYELPDEKTCELGNFVFSHLSSGLSQQHVGILFLLAFQLRTPGRGSRQRVFPAADPQVRVNDTKYSNLDDRVMVTSGMTQSVSVGPDLNDNSSAYAFLSAAFLKMFTRSPENFDKSWSHVVNGYSKFYAIPCPVQIAVPDKAVIKDIHEQFGVTELFRATLYRYLYMANTDDTALNVRKYLYDIHLAHTGMHIVPIGVRLCLTLNCEPRDLLAVIYSARFARQIDELVRAIELMGMSDDNHKRQMWKYGRIFDPTFLSALQTKSCPKLVYLLACMLKQEETKSAANILQIKQLEEVSPEDQERCRIGASFLLKILNAKVDNNSTPISQILGA